MRQPTARLAFLLVGVLTAPATRADPVRDSGPWDMVNLRVPPNYTRAASFDGCDEVLFDGEPYRGNPTRVSSYLARPIGNGPHPGLILVDRGGAYSSKAAEWAKRGYVVLAVDAYNTRRLPDGGPDELADRKLRVFADVDVKNMQAYHAVADVIRTCSLLNNLPEVDHGKIGLVGDGYLTCVVAGIDDRVKVAVAKGCCDLLREATNGMERFSRPGPKNLEGLKGWFESTRFLPQVRCPILFFTAIHEFATPLDALQTCYQAVPGDAWLSVRPKMPPSPRQTETPIEQVIFVEHALKGGTGLPKIEPIQSIGNEVQARFESPVPIKTACLYYTAGSGPWLKRVWKSIPATIDGESVRATLPKDRPLVYVLAITDNREAVVSTPHASIAK